MTEFVKDHLTFHLKMNRATEALPRLLDESVHSEGHIAHQIGGNVEVCIAMGMDVSLVSCQSHVSIIALVLQIPCEARCLGTRLIHSKTTCSFGPLEHKGSINICINQLLSY